jgi:cytochrome c5
MHFTMKTLFRKCTPATVVLFFIFTLSCTKYQIPDHQVVGPGTTDPNITSTCDPDTVYFQNDILPLVVSSCATTGCHNKDSHREGVILTDYSSIINTGKIKAGDPGDSEFFGTLTGNGEDLMPPRPYDPLSTDQIEMIRTWILQGAKNNACSAGCDTTAVSFAGQIWPMMETYCTGCHSSGAAGGGVVIADYTDVVSLAENGSLMGSVRWESGYANMPPNQQLSDCSISLLQAWIDKGSPQ